MASTAAAPSEAGIERNRRLELSGFHVAFSALVKAGSDSVSAAYEFGREVDRAIGAGYGYADLGTEVGRSGATIYLYARLYRKYKTVGALLQTAQALGTYDISKLVGRQSVRVVYVFQCATCGSFDVGKQKMTPDLAKEVDRARTKLHRDHEHKSA